MLSLRLTAPELDEVSFTHAKSVLLTNSVSPSSIRLERSTPTDRILFPLFRPDTPPFDFTVCNPPFFASEEEMREGQDRKAEGAHAVGDPRPALNLFVGRRD
jgi:methyltransferase